MKQFFAVAAVALASLQAVTAWPAHDFADAASPALGLNRRQAGVVAPNQTISIDPAYPTNVGFAGTTRNGSAPFLAQTDRIKTSKREDNKPYEDRYVPLDAEEDTDFVIARHWGNTSPYFPSPLFKEAQKYRQLDAQCKVERVFILHRHGDRYPTSYSTEGAPYFGALIANATKANNLSVSGPLSFLKNWTYELGAEILVPSGAQALFDSGVHQYYQYGRLYNGTTQKKPVIRTTSQQRMLDSARYWTSGFFGLDAPNLIDLQIILEGDGFNNTLASYDTCEGADNVTVGDTLLDPVWLDVYTKNAVKRLSQYVHKGFSVTPEVVYGMQSLCAYETVGVGYSHFCELFTKEEWSGFEYYLDLQFQGDYGAMSPSGRAQGIGWVQDLLARLEGKAQPEGTVTTQNTTLPALPLNQTLNVDFTHDDIIVSVLTALNFTQVIGDYLPATSRDPQRTFVLSHITPFAARLILEVVTCNGEEYIRAILNDALVPLGSEQGCTKRNDGMCKLSEFLAFQNKYAYKNANFDLACFGVNGTDYPAITAPIIRNGTVGASSRVSSDSHSHPSLP